MDEAQPAAAYLLIQSRDDEAPTEAGQNRALSPLSQPLASLGGPQLRPRGSMESSPRTSASKIPYRADF
jgi:hypothetical protein